MMCLVHEPYEIEYADLVGVWMYVYIYLIEEEGTRISRAECEDGAIYIILGGRDPYAGRSAKTVPYKYVYIYGGRDPYGTGGVRRRCYNTCICNFTID